MVVELASNKPQEDPNLGRLHQSQLEKNIWDYKVTTKSLMKWPYNKSNSLNNNSETVYPLPNKQDSMGYNCMEPTDIWSINSCNHGPTKEPINTEDQHKTDVDLPCNSPILPCNSSNLGRSVLKYLQLQDTTICMMIIQFKLIHTWHKNSTKDKSDLLKFVKLLLIIQPMLENSLNNQQIISQKLYAKSLDLYLMDC